MTARLLCLALLSTLGWSATASAQDFIEVPGGSWVTDITPDGSVVVGYGSGGGFYWRWQVDPMPTFIGGNDAQGVSDDGSVIVGCIQDPVLDREVAARWTQATGWVSLGWLPNALSCPSRSNAYDVSGDGSTVVGLSWDGCSGRGFRWTQATGMEELQVLGTGGNRASTISGDGSAIGGFAQSSTRTPAYWNPDLTGSVLDLSFNGEVNGFTEDGGLSVGTLYFSGSFYSAYVRTAAGVTTNLGSLNGNMAGNAQDISEDGLTIAGFDHISLSREGWVWTASGGIVSLNDRLSALGVSGVPEILVCNALSDDGNIVVGGFNAGGGGFLSGGYIAALGPVEQTWLNLGGGTSGINGVPTLTGTGTLVGGAPMSIDLVNAPGSTIMLLWVSGTSSPFNALGGTIHANPYDLQLVLGSSPTGTLSLATAWPLGLPSGTEVWFQYLLSDPSVLFDITMSNGLKGTTP